jgi:hypothetical protein
MNNTPHSKIYPGPYTHLITWNEYIPVFNIFVKKSLYTVEDAVQLHLNSLKKREYNDEGDQMIMSIKLQEVSQQIAEHVEY